MSVDDLGGPVARKCQASGSLGSACMLASSSDCDCRGLSLLWSSLVLLVFGLALACTAPGPEERERCLRA